MPSLRSELGWVVCGLPVAAIVLLTPSTALQIGMLGLVAALALGPVVPLRRVMTLVVYAGMATGLAFHIGEAVVRLDLLLLPPALVAAATQGRLPLVTEALQQPACLLLGAWIALEAATSALHSAALLASLWVVVWHISNLLIVALFVAAFADDREGLERVGIRAALVVAASGLATWLWAAATGRDNWGAHATLDAGLRAHGLAFEPNIFAATAVIWALALLTSTRLVGRRWLSVALLLAVVPLASSRAPILALIVGLAVYALARPGVIGRVLPLAAFGSILTAVAIVAMPSTFAPMFAKLAEFNFQNQTARYRYDSWNLAFLDLHVSGNWAFGMGANSFQQRHLDPTRPGENVGYHLSNLPLQALYDTGILGCALLACAVLALLKGRATGRRLALIAAFTVIALATSPFAFSSWWIFIALALLGNAVVGAPMPNRRTESLASH